MNGDKQIEINCWGRTTFNLRISELQVTQLYDVLTSIFEFKIEN